MRPAACAEARLLVLLLRRRHVWRAGTVNMLHPWLHAAARMHHSKAWLAVRRAIRARWRRRASRRLRQCLVKVGNEV